MSFDPNFKIPAHTRIQFQDTFMAAIQQNEAKFANTTNVESQWTAKQYVKRMRDTIQWRINNARFGKTNAREFEAGFRSGFWQLLEAEAIKFDRADQKLLDTIPVPTGSVIQDMMSGLNRMRDDMFLAAAVAPSLGGADPYVTPSPFPTENIIPVNYVKPGVGLGANSGLTVWKLMKAKTHFEQQEIDLDREELILGISPDEKTQLLLDAEAASNSAWAKIVLKWFEVYEGGNREAKLMGFKVITSNRLNEDETTGVRTCVAYTKKAFCSAPMSGVETKIDILPTDRHTIQVAAYADWGCFRVFDEMVLQIPCDPTP
ncbi:phage capsid protein [Prosthecobacter sp. SYSU 5D2]|uniref:phage capsid protein n=1 Tax=Prosthecobacter sp. SYSU 5D2 TaxID=3134134 RepID=UPI0031FF182C